MSGLYDLSASVSIIFTGNYEKSGKRHSSQVPNSGSDAPNIKPYKRSIKSYTRIEWSFSQVVQRCLLPRLSRGDRFDSHSVHFFYQSNFQTTCSWSRTPFSQYWHWSGFLGLRTLYTLSHLGLIAAMKLGSFMILVVFLGKCPPIMIELAF